MGNKNEALGAWAALLPREGKKLVGCFDVERNLNAEMIKICGQKPFIGLERIGFLEKEAQERRKGGGKPRSVEIG